jgi:hypothetical protein
VPPALDALVMQLLEVAPDRRPRGGAEVRAELLAMSTSLGPHGTGQGELARLVEEALRLSAARPSTRPVSRTAAAALTVPLRPPAQPLGG